MLFIAFKVVVKITLKSVHNNLFKLLGYIHMIGISYPFPKSYIVLRYVSCFYIYYLTIVFVYL